MSEGRHIRAVDGEIAGETQVRVEDNPQSYADAATEPLEEEFWDEPQVEERSRRLFPTVFAGLAIIACLAWTALYVWTHRAEMSVSRDLDRWIGWVTQWSIPLLLIAVAWLIAMRSSTREATRFGNAARQLSEESALLEASLVTVNRELSLAREFLSAQSRELDYLGRAAAEKISEHATRLQDLVVDNGAQVDAIAGVSTTALENMTQLRDHLPVIANSARDVSNQIGGAGRTAKLQLDDLVEGFERLNEFGSASERQVEGLRERIEGALRDLGEHASSIDSANADRMRKLREQVDALHAELDSRENDAVEAMRARLSDFAQDAQGVSAGVREAETAARTAWEAQIDELRAKLDTALAEIADRDQQALDASRAKLHALTDELNAADDRIRSNESDFEDRARARIAALEEAETAAGARLTEQGEAFDRTHSDRHEVLLARVQNLANAAETLAERLDEIKGHVLSIASRSEEAEAAIENSARVFADTVTEHAGELAQADGALNRLTDASVRLLELIQATVRHSRDQLPGAIEGFEDRLKNARENSEQIRDALGEARSIGDAIGERFETMHRQGDAAIGDLDAFRARLTGTVEEQTAALGDLRRELVAAGDDNRALADSVSSSLTMVIAKMREEGRAVLEDLETSHTRALASLRDQIATADGEERARLDQAIATMADGLSQLRSMGSTLLGEVAADSNERITLLASRVGEASAEAIDNAIAARTRESIAKLDDATLQSTEAAREAVGQMRDQLARVHELTVNLETRAARAREQVEEQVDNDFSRRMALITESLNSHSIDIAKALSTEVTDIAWASYLKGDRGIFTRRAVKLIDGAEARDISELYEADHEFREHVSRYIHDFEAMLRTMLSTRHGHALGVTLLSSDMGKLYVALAQAIQRLRQ